MESSILKQIARFLQEQKKQKRWLVVFLCLAIIVGFGTVTALKMRGQAMTHKEKRVICQLAVHQHADECYDENKENLICGYADYVVHVHNEDCYDWNGNLTCQLPEVEKHEHSEECYTEEATLICGLEETAGHQHGAECYTTQQGGLICQVPEHTHAAECYDETGAVICGLEEHIHEDACYEWADVLICQLAEGADGHTHTEACYEVKEILSCGKLELHTHTDECYEKINEEEELSETNRRLVCTVPVLEEHIHTEDAGCLETVEVTANGELVEEETVEEETAEKETAEGETEEEIFTTDLDGEDADGEGEEAEESEELNEADEADTDNEEEDAKQKKYDETKTCEGDGYVVTASYNKDANIPEEAEFIAKQITEESDAKRYKEHEAEFKKSVKNEDSTMSALFEIGFYVDGEEIAPESPVEITIQLVDKNGLPEGVPIKVVHFGDEKTEVLDGSEAESGSMSFKTDSFSPFAVGFDNEVADAMKTSVHISESTTYEDDVFKAIFHIEGDIKVAKDEVDDEGKIEDMFPEEETGEEETSEGETSEEEGAVDEPGTEEGAESENAEESDGIEIEEDGVGEEGTEDVGDSEDAADGSASDEGSNRKLKFEVGVLGADSDRYMLAVDHVERMDEEGETLCFQVLSCSLRYDGVEVDISDCRVTAKITTADALNEQAQNSIPEAVRQILNSERAEEIDEEAVENATEIVVSAMSVDDTQADTLGKTYLNGNKVEEPIDCGFDVPEETIALTAAATSEPMCTIQYYAYAQTLAKTAPADSEAIKIIDTSKEGNNGTVKLPKNGATHTTKDMYVKDTGKVKEYGNDTGIGKAKWEIYEPAYETKGTAASMTKLYTDEQKEYRDIAGGLDRINKFAKAGLNFDLYQVWVLEDRDKIDSTEESGWRIYDEEQVQALQFTNNEAIENDNVIVIKENTVIRLVGKSNETKEHTYPTRFFDYDFTEGTNDYNLKGINNPVNYSKNSDGVTVKTPRYGFGNKGNAKPTGLQDDELGGYYINQAASKVATPNILNKCFYGLVDQRLSDKGYPVIKANAPDLFNPESTVKGRTEYSSGYSLNFERDGDTYTLESVIGSGTHAQNLNQFQKGVKAWYDGGFKGDQIWTNQFWPMDSAPTFGDTDNGHDPKFGTKEQNSTGLSKGMLIADDGKEHNSFFGMNFEVEFKLTDDYVGPLNYYFFGDDDMWVFLEYPDGSTQLVCDIGGVHQAAGEYVDLWDYIEKPTEGTGSNSSGTDEERPTDAYKLKFFYTERGASGSTCWMQFTLPSVNAVPVIDYTGDVQSTLTVNKTVDGTPTDELFDFTIIFEGNDNVVRDRYPYQIERADKTKVTGDIGSGEIFKLGHRDTIKIFNLPDGTKYHIKEAENSGYEPTLGTGSTGTIEANETATGNIDWKEDDHIDWINKEVPYELPETGGYGPIVYTMAGVLAILSGAGFMYRKKVRERRV